MKSIYELNYINKIDYLKYSVCHSQKFFDCQHYFLKNFLIYMS